MLPISAELPLQQEWAALSKFWPICAIGFGVLMSSSSARVCRESKGDLMTGLDSEAVWHLEQPAKWNLCWCFIDEVATKRGHRVTRNFVGPNQNESLDHRNPALTGDKTNCPKIKNQTGRLDLIRFNLHNFTKLSVESGDDRTSAQWHHTLKGLRLGMTVCGLIQTAWRNASFIKSLIT